MILFDDGSGTTHKINSGGDMMKALNMGGDGLKIAMVDEFGQLIGLGNGSEGLFKSMPIIKAVRDAKPMVKSFLPDAPQAPRILFNKPAKTSLSKLSKDIADLQKSLSIGVAVDDDAVSDSEDIWTVIGDMNQRLLTIESSVKNIIAGII